MLLERVHRNMLGTYLKATRVKGDAEKLSSPIDKASEKQEQEVRQKHGEERVSP